LPTIHLIDRVSFMGKNIRDYVDRNETVRYDQKQEKCGLLSKATTVLPASGRAGLHTETFSTSP
jgi:hypothetical protein